MPVMDNSVLEIKKRGYLKVGVSLGLLGLSAVNDKKVWAGFDVDLAKAIAIAIFNDDRQIEYVPLASSDRFKALQENVIDVGTFNSSITLTREIQDGVKFCHPMLFDGERLMVDAAKSESSRLVSGDIRVAALKGSTTGDNLNRFFREENLQGVVHLYRTFDEARNAYASGTCNYYCLDSYLLAGERLMLERPKNHVILPHMISREAMSPATKASKTQLTDAVTWTLRSLIESESIGITSGNLDNFLSAENWYTRKFLHPDSVTCKNLGLVKDFTTSIIEKLGNYGEIFERHLGVDSVLALGRGENKLRSGGGMLYSPLFI
jgi:polar amino acid transport system substrate-binding protein